jgi:DNA invertase Pin-like site-specific DNA recombinase
MRRVAPHIQGLTDHRYVTAQNGKIPAVGYVRASTDQQEYSTIRQRREILEFGEKEGYEVVDWYEDDGYSGTRFETRPGFMSMVERIEKGPVPFCAVIVTTESRWGRGIRRRDNSGYKWLFERKGIDVVVINTNARTGLAVSDDVIESLEINEARIYSTNLSEMTLEGSKQCAMLGFSCGGTPPYGYKRIGVNKATGARTRDLPPGANANDDEKVKWGIGDPYEVQIVRRIFESKIKGTGDVLIADRLNREGVPCPKRGRWKNRDQKWAGGSVRVILTNPTYYGARVYNRHPQSHLRGPMKPAWLNPKEEWVLVENAHGAIITKEEFELANKDRKDYRRRNHHFYTSPHLLSGLIVCSHCGFNFQGQNYAAKRLRYYEDSGYVSKGKSVCTSYKINGVKLESFVVRAIRARILNSDLPKQLEHLLNEKVKRASADKLQTLDHISSQLREASMRVTRLLELAENGVSFAELVDRLKNAEKEKTALEKKMEEMKLANFSRKEIVRAKSEVQYLMDNFEEVLKNSPVHAQKELLRKFIHKIVVDRESDTIITYLKRIPSATSELNGNAVEVLGCVEVRMKVNKKSKSADKVKQTEESNNELTQTGVLTEN